MLLGRPNIGKSETINDADGFVANFWRAVSMDSPGVAKHADWPTNEADLFARHLWLVRHAQSLLDKLYANPDYYDAKIAGWWCWGICNWIGDGWCDGTGPWSHDGEKVVKLSLQDRSVENPGVTRKIPHMGKGCIGVNRQIPHGSASQIRIYFIYEWFGKLQVRLRDVRVTVGDWTRVLSESVTTRHGMTAVFLDPPYTKGSMHYAAGGEGGELANKVRDWCYENGQNPLLRIVLCGHAGEHDLLLSNGWHLRKWKARNGYGRNADARNNTASETLWCSPHCEPEHLVQEALF